MTQGPEGVDESESPKGTDPDPGSIPGGSTTIHDAGHSMRPEDWTVLGEYIRMNADRLGLKDWYLVLKHEPPGSDDALAEIAVVKYRRFAHIRVCIEFRDLTTWEQTNAVIHELMHCHLQAIPQILRETLPGQLGGATSHAILEAVHAEEERICDALATALTDPAGPIPWTTDEVNRDYQAPHPMPVD